MLGEEDRCGGRKEGERPRGRRERGLGRNGAKEEATIVFKKDRSWGRSSKRVREFTAGDESQ